MSINKADIASPSQRLVGDARAALGEHGFERVGRRAAFLRENDETLELLHFQRSSFSATYYLNYAIWLRRLGRPAALREELFHVWLRGDGFMRSKKKLRSFLSENPPLAGGFDRLLAREFLPFAEHGRSLAGVRRALRRGLLADAFILLPARRVLTRTRTRTR